MRPQLIFLFLIAFLHKLSAQESVRNLGPAFLVDISYAYQVPLANLSERFGNSFSLGLGTDYLTEETNWLFGISGNYTFGNRVNEDVLSNLRTPDGYIYGNNKGIADLGSRQRGFYVGIRAGKIISLSEKNPRSGLRLTLGLGFMEHRVRITEDPASVVPQITGDYRQGYDRLTNGLAVQQFLGYQLLGKDGRLNFYAGIELTEGFTRSRRSISFNTGEPDQDRRFDMNIGFRVGWILPFYLGGGEQIFY